MATVDAIVVGSGPNGLSAAVTLARAGLAVTLYERDSTIGGGARTAEITLPGFLHDICSAVHPLALSSGFFRSFELEKRIDLVVPELSYAQPMEGGRAGLAWRDLNRTVEGLGADGTAWRRLFAPLVARADAISQFAGSQILQFPRHPVAVALLGLRILEQGTRAWDARFSGEIAPALLAGAFAHPVRPMPSLSSAAGGLVLATAAHARGWPIPVGGSQSIMNALAKDFLAHGGIIETGVDIHSVEQLPKSSAVIFNSTPRALADIAGGRLPAKYVDRLRAFKYGNGIAKVDFALSGPVPWTNPELFGAPTLHLGGTRADLAQAESDVAAGRHPENPYVLLSQPTPFDSSRAPAGKHVLWAYTHVPAGSTVDRTEAIVSKIESYAPGFRDVILASTSRTAVDVSRYNPNYIGGDIASGDVTLAQLLARPVLSPKPWQTPAQGIYLASGSTAPGPGVHGLAGYYAALAALNTEFGITTAPSLGLTA